MLKSRSSVRIAILGHLLQWLRCLLPTQEARRYLTLPYIYMGGKTHTPNWKLKTGNWKLETRRTRQTGISKLGKLGELGELGYVARRGAAATARSLYV